MAGKRRKSAPPFPASEPSPASSAKAPADEAGPLTSSSPFPIVGVGASAGGLEAFTQMLSALPVDTGMAFVLVQHLAPTRASLLAEILARTTAMPVMEVQDEPRIEPDHVYVIAPDRNMVISRGTLQLLPRKEARGQNRPIDVFFRSLAAHQKHRAIGVILSGTASDGTLGLEEIKAEGGITFAQDDTAQQDSMPRSAVASGCVDFVLPPDEIAREIGRIARHPYVAPVSPAKSKAPTGDPDLSKILETVRRATGVTNEELATVNDELQNRNLELSHLNDELVNLLASVRRAREFAESIVATVREALVVLDADLRVQTASRSFYQTFHASREETEGRLLSDVRDGPWNDPSLRRLLDRVLHQEDGFDDVEVKYEAEPGSPRTLMLNARRLIQESGRSSLILLAIEDVTLRQHVQELAAADRSKNEFLALLAHELRNPLAPLHNAVQVLEDPGADAATAAQARELMGRQVHNMARLIDDLLDVSRITQGKIRLRKQPLDLAAVVQGAVELARPAIEARVQTLALALPPEPIVLEADATRLEQVFGNLLSNASKFTPTGGHVWLTVEPASEGDHAPGEVIVRVRDDGVGMSPETLRRAFDLFVQADRSLDRARGGLGIGLTLVRRLVELHGGTVEACSEGPDKGSEIVVRLPVSPHQNAVLERDAGTEAPQASSAEEPRRVLVVDDNADMAESLALLLRLRGHEVEVAYDGPAALDAAAGFRPDVVLLDIGLPGLDGYQVASALRRRRRTARALLVALTGYGQEDDQRRAREAGFDFHLTKPVAPQAIYALLTRRPE